MVNKQQTAVEWLEEQIKSPQWRTLKRADIIEKAKQMEKEQIVEAALSLSPYRFASEAERYYNETYGKDSTE